MRKNILLWFGPTPARALIYIVAVLVLVATLAWIFHNPRAHFLGLAERLGLWEEEQHQLVAVRDEEGKIKYWTCTMHPSVRAAEPGKCPICAMDLVPVRELVGTKAETQKKDVRGVTEMPGMPEGRPEGTSPRETTGLFTLSTERRQLIGVQFTEVGYLELEKTIRTVGRVELDQQKIAQVHPKIPNPAPA